MFKRWLTSDQKSMRVKLVAIVFEGVLAVAVLFILCNMAFGWLSKSLHTHSTNTNLSADNYGYVKMYAWRFDMDDETSGEAFDKTGVWVDAIDSDATSGPNAMLPTVRNVYNNDESGEAINFRSVHLGTVDNLLTLSNDNYFYARLDVTEISEWWDTPSIGFSVTESDVEFNDLNGVDRTSRLTDQQKQTVADIIKCECVISTNKYDPINNWDQLEALFENPTVIDNGNSVVSLGKQDDPYYIYIRFFPDLLKCFDATDEISSFMPCEILYDITVRALFG